LLSASKSYSGVSMKFKFIAIAFFIGISLFYYILSSFLLSRDNTPTWGTINYPQYILFSKETHISVSYQKIPVPVQVYIKTVYRNKAGSYSGEHQYKNLVKSTLTGSGEKSFVLPAFASDTIAQVRIKVKLLERYPGKNHLKNTLNKFDQPLVSRWIPVLDDAMSVERDHLTLLDTFSKGYQGGFWKDHRGDSSLIGWTITLFYFFCFCCLSVLVFKVSIPHTSDKVFWFTVTGIILFLAINKQLDLQMLVTDIARLVAKDYQVYEIRKPFQIRFISFFASIGFGTIILFILLFHKLHKSIFLASGGLAVLLLFLAFRLLSYHSVEVFMSRPIFGFSLFNILELTGVCMVCFAALWYLREAHTKLF